MKHIYVYDTTLCREDSTFSFKEKLEIARQLERLCADVIELPEIMNEKADTLLVKTVGSFVKKSTISVAAGKTPGSITLAAAALTGAAHPRIRIELPVSPVGMEYTCHLKPQKMLAYISSAVSSAKELCADVEFCAVDATRAEKDFLAAAIRSAVEAGANEVSVCDSAAEMLPDDFAAFTEEIVGAAGVPVGVRCSDRNGLAVAGSVLAVKHGVSFVKVSAGGDTASLETFSSLINNCGNGYGFETGIRYTELHRTVKQIKWVTDNSNSLKTAVAPSPAADTQLRLDEKDGREAVAAAVKSLGYELSDEDNDKVFEEFLRVAVKKTVGAKELEAIVASTALQVPMAYKLESYVVNNGNIISSSAQLTLVRDGKSVRGISMGDGPLDAAFRAIEQIIGRHFELDDLQIQSVTEGKEAVGSAIVKLRGNGKLYSGQGISTDIIGAGIRAYIGAVNKIIYEEV